MQAGTERDNQNYLQENRLTDRPTARKIDQPSQPTYAERPVI